MRRRWRSLRRKLKKLRTNDWIAVVTLVTAVIELVRALLPQ